MIDCIDIINAIKTKKNLIRSGLEECEGNLKRGLLPRPHLQHAVVRSVRAHAVFGFHWVFDDHSVGLLDHLGYQALAPVIPPHLGALGSSNPLERPG